MTVKIKDTLHPINVYGLIYLFFLGQTSLATISQEFMQDWSDEEKAAGLRGEYMQGVAKCYTMLDNTKVMLQDIVQLLSAKTDSEISVLLADLSSEAQEIINRLLQSDKQAWHAVNSIVYTTMQEFKHFVLQSEEPVIGDRWPLKTGLDSTLLVTWTIYMSVLDNVDFQSFCTAGFELTMAIGHHPISVLP